MNLEQTVLHILPKWFIGSWEWNNNQIIKWDISWHIQPTQAELETAWAEVEAIQQAEAIRQAKSEQIAQIATLTDQLNLLWRTLYKLTEWSTDPEIIEARQAYEAIQAVLNS